MEDLVTQAAEAQNESPEVTAGTQPLAAGHEGGINHSDPIPSFGGLTQDALTLRNKGAAGLDNLDDNLFAAVMAGDETYVKSRLGGSDKVLSEAEELILVLTRRHEEEISYEKMLERAVADDSDADDGWEAPAFGEEAEDVERAALMSGRDAYGGRHDRKRARYYDRFGGTYDISGYQFKDGSYKTAAGDHYSASEHTVRLAIGGDAEQLPEELRGMGADIMRLAVQIAGIREQARAGRKHAAAQAELAPAHIHSAAAAAFRAIASARTETPEVETVAYAVPSAVALGSTLAAAQDDASFAAALAANEADERTRFNDIATDDRFLSDVARAEGDGLGHLSCHCLTRKDLRMAACMMNENIEAGRTPHLMTRYQFQNLLLTPDDAEDVLAQALRLSPSLNGAFAKAAADAVSLSEQAAAVFGRQPANTDALVASIVQEKPKPMSFKRPGMALA